MELEVGKSPGLAVLGSPGTDANSTDRFAAAGGRAKGRAELAARVTLEQPGLSQGQPEPLCCPRGGTELSCCCG